MSTRPEDLEVELRDVVVALKDVAGTQWYDLGLQLQLSPSTLDTIAAHHNVDDHKRMMLRKWLQSDPEASWEKLAAALTLIGHKTTAAAVRRQFVRVAVQIVAETVTPTEEDEIRIAFAKSNLQKIKGQFSALLWKVQSALESNRINVDEVHTFLIRYFERDDWIQNPSHFSELFNVLSVAKLWSYDHYGPLELIITHFLPDDADIDAHMTDYESKLTGFYTTTKIADFIKLSDFEDSEQDPQQPLPVHTLTLKDYRRLKLKLKLSRKVSAVTLSYVDELWRSLAKKFDLPSLTAVIHSIVEGSLEVTWLVLPHIAEKIVANSRNSDAIKFFCHHGIVLVEIDDHLVYCEELMVEYERELFEICQGNANVSNIGKLVACGVDLNIFDEAGNTPLFLTSERGLTDVVKALLHYGANANQLTISGYFPLHYACARDHIETVKVLLEYGAQVNQANDSSFSDVPLTIACAHGNADIATLLIDNGAVVNFQNKDGNTPLHKACWNKHPHMVKLLLERGAQVDMLNEKGETVLYWASGAGSMETVKILLEYGAQVNQANNSSFGDVPLTIACGEGNADIAALLIDNGAVVNFQSKRGAAPLHGACLHGHSHIAKMLIERGADIDIQMKDQRTPLFIACFNGHLETVTVLLRAGAQPDIPNKTGLTGLMVACQKGLVDIAKALLEARADTDMTEKSTGWTAVFFAAKGSHMEIVRLLIIHGADVDIRDETGVTAADIAKVNSHPDVCELLQQHSNQEKNTELSKEQKLEVKSVGDRVKSIFKILEETFLSERVRKREHQTQQDQQHQENRLAIDILAENELESLQQTFECNL